MLIIINEVPLSKNQYVNLHWSKRKKYKKHILDIIQDWKDFEEEVEEGYKELPYKKAKLYITIFFRTNRKRDAQNYEGGGLIAWIDCLVDLGYIKNDDYSVIGQPLIFFEIDKEFPRTEINIVNMGKSSVP